MFVRTKTTEGRTYLQVVESYWQDGRPRQRVIATLGRLDKLSEKGQIDGILRSLARFSDKIKVAEEYQAGKLKATRVRKNRPRPHGRETLVRAGDRPRDRKPA